MTRKAGKPVSWMRTSDQTWDMPERYGADAIQINEPDEDYSGLLDERGNPLYRKSRPVGFIRFKSDR